MDSLHNTINRLSGERSQEARRELRIAHGASQHYAPDQRGAQVPATVRPPALFRRAVAAGAICRVALAVSNRSFLKLFLRAECA